MKIHVWKYVRWKTLNLTTWTYIKHVENLVVWYEDEILIKTMPLLKNNKFWLYNVIINHMFIE